MAYATLAELKTQLNKTSTADDVELQVYLDAAEQMMVHLIGPSSVLTFTDPDVLATRSGKLVLQHTPLVAVTAVTGLEDSIRVALSNVVIEDAPGGILRHKYRVPFWGRYAVDYSAGRSVVLSNHKLACLIIAQHLWRLQNGGGGAPYPGETDFATVGYGYAVPRRALDLLRGEPSSYSIPGIA